MEDKNWKIKCPYCGRAFDYSKEEIEWVPIFKMKPSREKYVVTCKNCGKRIEFWI